MVLCAASIICRGCPRTESETRQIYDTDDLFGEGRIQEYLVEKWARLSGKWIDEPESYPDERMSFMYDRGRDAGMDYGMHLNYNTDNLYVGDLNEFNVLKGESGYHVIDADCRLNVPGLECGGTYIVPSPELDFSRPFDDWKTFL